VCPDHFLAASPTGSSGEERNDDGGVILAFALPTYATVLSSNAEKSIIFSVYLYATEHPLLTERIEIVEPSIGFRANSQRSKSKVVVIIVVIAASQAGRYCGVVECIPTTRRRRGGGGGEGSGVRSDIKETF
jgi:hypothetical protein